VFNIISERGSAAYTTLEVLKERMRGKKEYIGVEKRKKNLNAEVLNRFEITCKTELKGFVCSSGGGGAPLYQCGGFGWFQDRGKGGGGEGTSYVVTKKSVSKSLRNNGQGFD